jgi:hypothetical protein
MKKFKIKQLPFFACIVILFLSCNSKKSTGLTSNDNKIADTLSYAYKATYSADITVPSHPEYAQKVLTVWKMFETNQVDAMKQYYADTVTYEDASGYRFHGKSDDLLNFPRKDIEELDSLRFDISTWQSLHLNDRDEDWVYIWAAERRYPKKGNADTTLIHEQWQVKNGKVVFFNQYKSKPAK